MKTNFNREPITSALLTALEPTAADDPATWTVGDAQRPSGGGWQGDIGDSSFAPYVVLTPLATPSMVASSGNGFGSMDPVTLPYSLTIVGISRRQTELLADHARNHLGSVVGTQPGNAQAEITSVLPDRIGSPQRMDQDHGAYYVQTDLVHVRVSST